jgi:intein-encoded DNA endonuclease-like protein
MKYKPLELRIMLYDVVHRLRRQGLTYREIIQEVEKSYNVRLAISTVYFWLKEVYNPKRGTKLLPENIKPCKDLSWIIGVIAGDGSTWATKYNYNIRLKCKDFEFAKEFARCLKVIGCKPWIGIQDGYYIAMGYSRVLYNLLKKPLDLEKLRYYIEYDEKTITAFLKGFFDSEGYVNKMGYILVYNTDSTLLDYVKRLLLTLKIEVTGPHLHTGTGEGTLLHSKKMKKTYRRRKNLYYLYVKANSSRRFAELIGFSIKRKMDRLLKN